MRLQEGPWGGGNAAVGKLSQYLQEHGVEVVHDLSLRNADIVLLTDPRRYLRSCAFDHRAITRYLVKNKTSLVVHRINECDERKGTAGLNKLIVKSNWCADHTIFVGSWLRDHFLKQNLSCLSTSVILNGSDRKLFNADGYQPWDRVGPMRLVTHHWGGNWLKGFDIYQKLDDLLLSEKFRGKIRFTYIGNLPKGFSFRNTVVIPPLSGTKLTTAIKQNHVYLTASKHEPGSNHQNEGASCGLPLLYISSGCLPEYCAGYGLEFTEENFVEKLSEMLDTYEHWVKKMEFFPRTADQMCLDYLDTFERLLLRRKELLKERRLWTHPFRVLGTISGLA